MEEIYQEIILDHNKNPHNKMDISDCICKAKGDNPSCGDTAELCIVWENNCAREVKWDGYGCAISMAACSMLSDYLINKNIHEIKSITPATIYKFLNIQITPSRVNCALLSYRALEQVLIKYDIMNK